MAKRPTRAKPARPKPAKAKPELQASANAPAPRNSARDANSGFGDDQRTGLPLKRIGDAPPEGVGPNGITPTPALLPGRDARCLPSGVVGPVLSPP